MGNRTITRTTIISFLICIALLFTSSVYSASDSNLKNMEVSHLCSLKTKLIEWTIENTEKMSSEEMLFHWNNYFVLLKFVNDALFLSQTKIEGERIIRDVHRLKPKLQDKDNRRDFFQTEIQWCMFYQH